jgi:hypothetical protein
MVVGVTRARVSRRVGAGRVADQVQRVHVVQRWVLHMDPLHLAGFAASLPTRRDTRFRPNVVRQAAPGMSGDLDSCPPRARSHGHYELTAVTPVICRRIPTGQHLLVRVMIHSRSSKLAMWVCFPFSVYLVSVIGCVFRRRYLVWLLLTVELSILHRPFSATSR